MDRTVRDAAGREVETVDEAQAPRQLHEGAIYLHQTSSYLVTKLDQAAKVAEVKERYARVHRPNPSWGSLCKQMRPSARLARDRLGVVRSSRWC